MHQNRIPRKPYNNAMERKNDVDVIVLVLPRNSKTESGIKDRALYWCDLNELTCYFNFEHVAMKSGFDAQKNVPVSGHLRSLVCAPPMSTGGFGYKPRLGPSAFSVPVLRERARRQ